MLLFFLGTRIGKNCKVFPGVVLGAIPQDLKFHGEYSTVEIGDRVVIRECATINRGTDASGTTKIGNDTMLMAYVHVAHDCNIGAHCILANSTNLAGHVTIEDYAYFGGMSGAHQFTKIGKHSFISGGSMIGKDVSAVLLGHAKSSTICRHQFGRLKTSKFFNRRHSFNSRYVSTYFWKWIEYLASIGENRRRNSHFLRERLYCTFYSQLRKRHH